MLGSCSCVTMTENLPRGDTHDLYPFFAIKRCTKLSLVVYGPPVVESNRRTLVSTAISFPAEPIKKSSTPARDRDGGV